MRLALQAVYDKNTGPHVVKPEDGGVLLCTGEPDFFGNFGIGTTVEKAAEAAASILSPGLAMFIVPGPPAPEWEGALAPHGFVHGGSIPAMSVDLASLREPALAPGYTFERLRKEDDGATWAKVLSESYPVAPVAAGSMSPLHVDTEDSPDSALQYFQVRCGDEVVGVSLLALIDGSAGIYCVGTMPGHRRRGLGAALTAFPLKAARELGYRTGVLQASEAGYGVYRSLGFEDDGQVQLYVRVPEDSDHA